jgi:hypothetical protein
MFNIIGLLKGAFELFNKLTDFFAKKDMENQIKNSYEKDKKIDALEQNAKVADIIDKSEKRVEEAKEAIKNVSKAKEEDAKLSDEDVKKVLSDIVDPDDKKARGEQIKIAKEIKEAADKKQAELEKNKKFNDGEEIVFKG